MPRMRALKSISNYSTRRLKAGDEFEADAKWARIFRGTRQAKDVPPPAASSAPASAPAKAKPDPDATPTRTTIYRMSKAERAAFLRDRGQEVDEEEESSEELRDRALELLP